MQQMKNAQKGVKRNVERYIPRMEKQRSIRYNHLVTGRLIAPLAQRDQHVETVQPVTALMILLFSITQRIVCVQSEMKYIKKENNKKRHIKQVQQESEHQTPVGKLGAVGAFLMRTPRRLASNANSLSARSTTMKHTARGAGGEWDVCDCLRND